MSNDQIPRVILYAVPQPVGTAVFDDAVELLPWEVAREGAADVQGVFMFGHATVDGPMMDRLPDSARWSCSRQRDAEIAAVWKGPSISASSI